MSQMPSNSGFDPRAEASAAQDTISDLAVAAARGERRNKPTLLIALSAILLVAGVVFAVVNLFGYTQARAAAEKAKAESTAILEQTALLRALIDEEANGSGVHASDPSTNVLSTIEAAGSRAGLQKAVPLGNRSVTPDRTLGWNLVRYSYNVKDPSLDALLNWSQLVLEDLPSLEVYSVTLRPEATEWSYTIVYSRWEKPEGS